MSRGALWMKIRVPFSHSFAWAADDDERECHPLTAHRLLLTLI
jgi:hypothetical protein